MFDKGYDLGDASNEDEADGYIESWNNFHGPVHPDRDELEEFS